ncbi:hypothetical protein BDN71DRAFT_1217309 [Pleurotus eryngii]|uniref:Uncharacterized protein n=1 Tax=Pleurotus eryngii TaxID=5323 RepID=A0A9P6DDR7_PLEER|nr:hypothetical protein BDN71DRAFT_1217309 [Pleurotus eryngii]
MELHYRQTIISSKHAISVTSPCRSTANASVTNSSMSATSILRQTMLSLLKNGQSPTTSSAADRRMKHPSRQGFQTGSIQVPPQIVLRFCLKRPSPYIVESGI